ncbi:2-dehydropantoate 2-reductase-like protein [Lophiotrema nucula]|uniref:2-dehydropantoate 2-reductase n=1 Tax=Lophiotrema nucula TaxID=690887 RepID=A0A6A5Z5Y9_9PLEO|nr:2-dehydropantoate 2-reductase-like protein [Lophiotrema nucula]
MIFRSPIHVLGVGSLGKLFAHSLRKCYPALPITLLFHRPSLLEEWKQAGQAIEVVRDGKSEKLDGFEYEGINDGKGEIRNLICATKTYGTVPAMEPLKHRLGPSSSILFLQNGIGTIDEVNSQIFKQASLRPHYFAGIVNHGVYQTAPFTCVHASVVDVTIGPILDKGINNQPASPLIESILGCSILAGSLVTSEGLFYIQMKKLVINAIINPLSAIFDVQNGQVFDSPTISALIKPLAAEISAVIQAIIQYKGLTPTADVATLFTVEGLEAVVRQIGVKVAKNSSSMRQDMRNGRRTEIDYINAYIVTQGRSLGIDCPLNSKLVGLVRDKRLLAESEAVEISKA